MNINGQNINRATALGPYCPQCGAVAPGWEHAVCIPCVSRGHWYRLVNSEQDRQNRLADRLQFWYETGGTQAEVITVPSFARLMLWGIREQYGNRLL